MNGGETNADGANADDPTAWRPPFDALSAILQKSSGANSAIGFGIISRDYRLAPWTVNVQPRRSGDDGAPDCWRPQRRALGIPALDDLEGFFPRCLLGRPLLHELGSAEAAVAIGLFRHHVLSSFVDPVRDLRAPRRWCRRLFGAKEYPGELPQFTIVKQPAQHVRWDLKRALLIKLVAGRKFKPIIEPVHRCRHAGADERRRLDNHSAGKATVRMTIVQPKERHILKIRPGLAGREGGKLS